MYDRITILLTLSKIELEIYELAQIPLGWTSSTAHGSAATAAL